MNIKVTKTLTLISAGLMLAGTGAAIILPTQTVNAVSSKTMSKYARKFHKVVVIEPMWVYRVYPRYPMYKAKYIKAYKLKPGDTVSIRYRGVDWGWTIGKSYKYCTLSDGFYWFEPYQKYIWVDQSVLDGADEEERIDYKLSWKQYCTLFKKGISTTNHPKKLWRTTIKPLIEKWKPETDDF